MTRDRLYLRHILDALDKIETHVAVGRETFLATSHWQDAVIRQVEIVGEATSGSLQIFVQSIHKCPGDVLQDYATY